MGLMPVKYRRGGPPAPEGMRWVITNRGQKEPGIFLYEEEALGLLDRHRQSKAEIEVSEVGGWGMQKAGSLRDWDLCVNIDDEEEQGTDWYRAGELFEEWDCNRPPPELRYHTPGDGAAQRPSLASIGE